MSRLSTSLAPVLLIICGTIGTASAQEFRVYTRIFDEGISPGRSSNDPANAPVLARSLTLFRAGKVYDYINEVGEVIIFEPQRNRFRILDGSRMISTTVDFDEVKRMLAIAEMETEKYIQQLLDDDSPTKDARMIQPLRFQLDPQFDEQFDPESRRLTLANRYFRYDVMTAENADPEAIDAYLHYADWTARLNSVLHPRSLLPNTRLLLDESLRTRRKMPLEVELRAELETELHLRAKHQFHWKLESEDRRLIHHWETLLKNETMKEVTFREYQRAVLVSTSK